MFSLFIFKVYLLLVLLVEIETVIEIYLWTQVIVRYITLLHMSTWSIN